jgi:hypothetical protein
MTKADQFAIEVHFVPLPVNELEERRDCLRTLLLRGALRVIRQQNDCSQAQESQTNETVSVGAIQK